MTTNPAQPVFVVDDAEGLLIRRGRWNERLTWAQLPARFGEIEHARPRWVWADTSLVYPHLLALGLRAEQCRDLTMVHTLLANSREAEFTLDAVWARSQPTASDDLPSLLDLPGTTATPDLDALERQFALQERAIAAASRPGRLRLLAAAESAGALVACEMGYWGMPWEVAEHDRLLVEQLGARGLGRPAKLTALVEQIRTELNRPALNPDSQPDLLRALRGAGLNVASTRKWELAEIDHPVIEPLLTYKRLTRLHSANGWAWMDQWVRAGRFHPDYQSSAVVTGRWATSGGGALQLPKEIRSAVRAGPGAKLVVADAAQLEPRVLAAMSGDRAMARAALARDLYQALVEDQVVGSRAEAKVAMLGAMYGATSGTSGRLMPRLRRSYPSAMRLVDDAARAGERGEVVSTFLGRSSPAPGWVGRRFDEQPATEAERARSRDWGRFTRNFVVQGTAAEWALCWLAQIRNGLARLDGPARLVYFLHDEVIVECGEEVAGAAREIVVEAARRAGALLFFDAVDFPVIAHVVDDYGQAAH